MRKCVLFFLCIHFACLFQTNVFAQNSFPATGQVSISSGTFVDPNPGFSNGLKIGGGGLYVGGNNGNYIGCDIGISRQNTNAGVGQGAALQFTDLSSNYSNIIQSAGNQGLQFLTTPGGTSWQEAMRIMPNGYIGIGTSNPQGILHIAQNDGASQVIRTPLVFSRYWASESNTRASTIFHYTDGAYDKMVFNVSGDGGSLATPLNYTTAKMVIQSNGNIGIGTISPQSLLAVNGTITTKEVNVTTSSWSDFVFEPAYKLTPLDSLSQQINSLGHLPNMPSTADIEKNGLSLGDIIKRQQQKIEELTLYVIEQNKRMQKLEEQNKQFNRQQQVNNKQQAEIDELKNEIKTFFSKK